MRADPHTEQEVLDLCIRGLRASDIGDWPGFFETISESEDFLSFGTGEDERALGRSYFEEASVRDLVEIESSHTTVDWHFVGMTRDRKTAWVALEMTVSTVSRGAYSVLPMRFTGVLQRDSERWRFVLQHSSIPAHPAGTAWPGINQIDRAIKLDSPPVPASLSAEGGLAVAFTDIENSTPMSVRLGDEGWMQLLRYHNAVVRRHIRDHGGVEVKSVGDGFMVAFGDDGKALQFAVALQREFDLHNARHRDEPIRVRVGMHRGPVLKEDDDMFGQTVIIASRIAALARPAEILVSAPLLSAARTAGFVCDQPRRASLKGLPGKHDLYAVSWK